MICKKGKCTECKACINICPVSAIAIRRKGCIDSFAFIDKNKCINCDLCKKVCPVNIASTGSAGVGHEIRKCFSAWSSNVQRREICASGGVVSESYLFALENNYKIIGTLLKNNGEVIFELSSVYRKEYANSKYTFSDMNGIYGQIVDELKSGCRLLFVGLPCQCAAVNNFIEHKGLVLKKGDIIYIDLICHGVPPKEYFVSHLKRIKQKYGINDSSKVHIYFRDPELGTDMFFFSIYKSDDRVYSVPPFEYDVYQQGYHKALIYRDSCFRCSFANRLRIGDITVGDFPNVGTLMPEYTYGNKKQTVY